MFLHSTSQNPEIINKNIIKLYKKKNSYFINNKYSHHNKTLFSCRIKQVNSCILSVPHVQSTRRHWIKLLGGVKSNHEFLNPIMFPHSLTHHLVVPEVILMVPSECQVCKVNRSLLVYYYHLVAWDICMKASKGDVIGLFFHIKQYLKKSTNIYPWLWLCDHFSHANCYEWDCIAIHKISYHYIKYQYWDKLCLSQCLFLRCHKIIFLNIFFYHL